eukprot:345860_1
MNKNEHGLKLYSVYGFNEDEGWFIESINGYKVSNKVTKDVGDILNGLDVNKGYEVVFKTNTKSTNILKKVQQMKRMISKESADRSQHLLSHQNDEQLLRSKGEVELHKE